jgi:hypothetical protein
MNRIHLCSTSIQFTSGREMSVLGVYVAKLFSWAW